MSVFQSPLFFLTLTLTAYVGAIKLQERLNNSPLLHPVLVAALALAGGLKISGITYATYFQGGFFVHFLLGPATVALAIPLYTQLHQIKRALWPIMVSVTVGSFVAVLSALGITYWLHGSHSTMLSIAPKSVTTPIAIAVSEKIGGNPEVTVICVVCTGILGAMMGPWFLTKLGIRDPRAAGLGLGVAAHAMGTSRAVQMGETAGAFASLAMGLTGFLTALLLPLALE